MASSLNSIAPHHFLPLAPKLSSKPKPTTSLGFSWTPTFPRSKQLGSRSRSRWLVAGAVADEVDVISVRSSDSTDHQGGGVGLTRVESDLEGEAAASTQVVGGFGDDARLSFQGFSSGPAFGEGNREVSEDVDKLVDRAINAIIVFAAGSFAIARLLTIDHDYWHMQGQETLSRDQRGAADV